MIFKCKNCGGNVVYSPERRKMFCPFCESEDSGQKEFAKDNVDAKDTDLNKCPNCGGEIDLKEHTSATKCPYCDSYIVLDERVGGEYTPKFMIPFHFGKEVCKKTMKDHFKAAFFAPADFLSEVRLNTMQGIYVPFWFYNYEVNYDMEAEGTKVRSWTSGDRRYTETSYYQILRNMDIDFKEIPADASIEMPDPVMDLMAPYDYSQFVSFSPEYMSGFYAEKYNMTSDVIESRARERMRNDTVKIADGSYSGYSSSHIVRNRVDIRREWAEYGLLPVWKYVYQYKDQEYPFYINGQTGKVVGNAPISAKKVWGYTGTLWACITVILLLINLAQSLL